MGTGPGKGRYTVFVPPKSPRRSFLEKLFKGTNTSWAPVVGSTEQAPPFVGLDQQEAIAAAVKAGNDILRGLLTDGVAAGDPGLYPNGVDLTFHGRTADIQAPDTTAGKDGLWSKPGDPANSFVPDITSPGPGKTNGLDKDQDPKIKSVDVTGKENYVPAGPDSGTKSPDDTAQKLYESHTLGGDFTKGKSGTDV